MVRILCPLPEQHVELTVADAEYGREDFVNSQAGRSASIGHVFDYKTKTSTGASRHAGGTDEEASR